MIELEVLKKSYFFFKSEISLYNGELIYRFSKNTFVDLNISYTSRAVYPIRNDVTRVHGV